MTDIKQIDKGAWNKTKKMANGRRGRGLKRKKKQILHGRLKIKSQRAHTHTLTRTTRQTHTHTNKKRREREMTALRHCILNGVKEKRETGVGNIHQLKRTREGSSKKLQRHTWGRMQGVGVTRSFIRNPRRRRRKTTYILSTIRLKNYLPLPSFFLSKLKQVTVIVWS